MRQAIAAKSTRMNGLQADPDTEILVTLGAKEAIFLAMMALVNPGDEVLIPDPEWVSYVPCVELAGGRIVRFPLHEKNGFQPDIDDLERRITSKTKMIVISTPHNPTGAIFDAPALNGIAALAHKHNLVVLSDEVYEHYVYDNHRHQSIGSLPGMKERTVTISGTSKIFNMFGWRVGWAIAAPAVITSMAHIHQNTVACATSFAQAGTIAALQLGDDIIAKRVRQYQEAGAPLIDGLNGLGLSCHRPEGAYFVFPNISKLGRSSEEVSRLLLEKGGIQSVSPSTSSAEAT
ncbi:MAG: aminotransferase class I/II-fold pyridoxal phosphate-dependent enzyme [Rhizobiales bacterium]|nr:aminotransferase class I/II-fold pyridoxal phosphate-dependent enzyme [Hyphomicrobiales bacterium]